MQQFQALVRDRSDDQSTRSEDTTAGRADVPLLAQPSLARVVSVGEEAAELMGNTKAKQSHESPSFAATSLHLHAPCPSKPCAESPVAHGQAQRASWWNHL